MKLKKYNFILLYIGALYIFSPNKMYLMKLFKFILIPLIIILIE